MSEGGVGMMSINNTFATTTFLPSHTCGRGVGGEGGFELPGVALRLVTFFCFAKKKVTKEKATPIRHIFEVPCVARLVRLPHKLARSAARPRTQTYSSEFPDQPALLGGGTGEGKTKKPKNFNRRVGKLPTNYQNAAWAPCAHPTGVQRERDLIL